MKRDWNLIRAVLEAAESETLDDFVRKSGADCDEDDLTQMERDRLIDENAKKYRHDVLGHLERCIDAGFLKGIRANYYSDGSLANADVFRGARLTMQGHDFLAQLRDRNTWKRIKETAKQTGVQLTVQSICEIGKYLVGQALAAV